MRFGNAVVFFVMLTLTEPLAAGESAARVTDACGAPLSPTQTPPAGVQTIDAIAAVRLGELLRDSMVVREMIGYLDTARVALIIRSSATLVRDHRAGGLSRFYVEAGVLKGRVEFDRVARTDRAQRITLAHEVGHAVELATLTRRSTAALGNQLLSRNRQHDPWSAQLTIETAFAQGVDALVAGELKYGAAPAGALEMLAKRHGISLVSCAAGRANADAGAASHGAPKKD
jgi:hypothetical protein